MDSTFTLTVNGRRQTIATDPQRPLLEVLREEFHLTGTKYGCGEGYCGACTVLLDGKRHHACQVPVAEAALGFASFSLVLPAAVNPELI